jgi:hypothetical protein
VDAENKRRKGRRRRCKKSPGRKPTELKFAEAEPVEDIFPADGVGLWVGLPIRSRFFPTIGYLSHAFENAQHPLRDLDPFPYTSAGVRSSSD